MDIYIYEIEESGALALKGITDRAKSLCFTRRFYKGGSFEAVFPASARELSLISRGRVIEVPGRFCGIITSFRAESGAEKNAIRVSGLSPDGMLARRIALNVSENDSLMTVLDKNAGARAYGRGFPGAVFDSSADIFPEDNLSLRYLTLEQYAEKAGEAANFGVLSEIAYENTPYIRFYGRSGEDRSEGQSENPLVIFSESFGNIRSAERMKNDSGAMTNAVVFSRSAVTGSGDRFTVPEWSGTFGEYRGWDSAEKAYEISPQIKYDIQAENTGDEIITYHVPVIDRAASRRAGAALQLSKFSGISEETGITLSAGENYRGRFDIGDRVTAKSESLGFAGNAVINEITERYENGGFTAFARLGSIKTEE